MRDIGGRDARVLQGSSVSLIMFVIYLSGIFKKVEEEIEECIATLFADYYGWLVTADSVAQLCERLEREGEKPVEWGKDSQVEFDNVKDETIVFTGKGSRS